VSTRRGPRNTRSNDAIGAPAGVDSRARLDSRVTVLANEQAVEELGIDAKLSDIVAKAQSIESGVIPSRSRRKTEQMC
jgi:hypothetical protein